MRTRLAVLGSIALAAALGADARADAERDRWVAWGRRRALLLQAEGRTPEAVEAWRALAQLTPEDPHAAARAAVAMIEMIAEPPKQPKPTDPEYRAAQDLIGAAIRAGGVHDPALAYAWGRLRFADGDYQEAEERLGIARRRGYDPVRTQLWHGRAVISDTARLLAGGGSGADVAIDRLKRMIDENPGHPDLMAARINLATAFALRGEQPVAYQILEDVVRQAPWNARAHLALAQTYADVQKYDESDAEYKKARDTATQRDDGLYTGKQVLIAALRSQAGVQLRRGGPQHLDACERTTRQYLELEKDAPEGLYYLGMVRKARGTPEDLAEAAKLLRRAHRGDPSRADFCAALIQVLTLLDEKDEAALVQKDYEALKAAEAAERDRKAKNPPK